MGLLRITPLTEHTGAEVAGIDFTRPVDAGTRAALNGAFSKYHVLVMRGQNFTPAEYKRAATVFGQSRQHGKREHHVPGHPDLYYVSNDTGSVPASFVVLRGENLSRAFPPGKPRAGPDEDAQVPRPARGAGGSFT